ncbi:MAG: T9SS type A sorting domain-containing protein, partial [Bacteroidota bacterium]|nr:T9SS type A sorting domain-containing protein [Bacteroidota bacterium]
LYPNPSSDLLNIEVEKLSSVRIFDLSGRLVLQSDKIQFNISALSNGIYSVMIISGENSVVKKLVKISK